MLDNDEFLTILKANKLFSVVEVIEPYLYSLIVIYEGNTICGTGVERRGAWCNKYLSKKAKIIWQLQLDVKKIGISIK